MFFSYYFFLMAQRNWLKWIKSPTWLCEIPLMTNIVFFPVMIKWDLSRNCLLVFPFQNHVLNIMNTATKSLRSLTHHLLFLKNNSNQASLQPPHVFREKEWQYRQGEENRERQNKPWGLVTEVGNKTNPWLVQFLASLLASQLLYEVY